MTGTASRSSFLLAGVALVFALVDATPASVMAGQDVGTAWTEQYNSLGAMQLIDVDCSTQTDCVALGAGANGGAVMYRSTDDAIKWSGLVAPSYTQAPWFSPASVWLRNDSALSCTSANFCMIEEPGPYANKFGNGFEVTYDGGETWSEENGIDLGTRNAQLTGITCPAAQTCVGVGAGGIVSTTDGGKHWGRHETTDTILQVDCLSPRNCYVLYESLASSGAMAYRVARSDNRGGTLTPILQVNMGLNSGGTGFAALSCSAAQECSLAVLGARNELESTADGGMRWRSRSLPGGAHSVRALSCGTEAGCTLLTTNEGGTELEAATTWNSGASWTLSDIAPLSRTSPMDSPKPSLVCEPKFCAVTASWAPGSVGQSVYRLAKGSARWVAMPIATGTPALSAVACASSGGCMAVGSGDVVASDNGEKWSQLTVQALSGVQVDTLTCPSSNACLAAGWSGSEGPQPGSAALFTTGDFGVHWSEAELPDGVASIASVACASTEVCVAVPNMGPNWEALPAYVLRSTDGGIDWSLISIAPAGASDALEAIVCPAVTTCIGVGMTPGGPTIGDTPTEGALVARSSDAGATWELTPEPSASAIAGFWGLSCTSDLDCATSGLVEYTHNQGTSAAFGSTDGGSTWGQLGSMNGDDGATLAACALSNCWGIGANAIWPGLRLIDSSDDGGQSWTTDAAPADFSDVVGIATTNSGAPIAIGTNSSGGAEILLGSP